MSGPVVNAFRTAFNMHSARGQTALFDFSTAKRFVVDGLPISSIRGINDLGTMVASAIYRTLIPDEALLQYNIDPRTLTDVQGDELVEFICPPGTGSVEVKVWHQAGARDPLLYLQLADNVNHQLSVLLFVVNDPTAPRFDVDRDWRTGEPTKFGTQSRNTEAEFAAMQAGLAPGQVRRGLKLTRKLMPLFEIFVSRLGHQMFFMEPLAYHNALLFERYGCAYSQGRARMEWINREFAPGGTLYHRLDGSTPFRRHRAERTIRGRSWAIHDGLLGEPFGDIHMYKRIGINAGICTFPSGVW
jgi:hypothetical protein